ncbi:MAG: hypothetical protein ACLR9T_03475 [Thomasclavelia sp.]|uniref:hypothetical protein n=1 Tax=Thomasclavelia sp. TaxID=3025757 RepID=UPI00399F7C24
MKSNPETLRKRGFITSIEAQSFFLYSKEELFKLLGDKQAVNRTAALCVLKKIISINELDEILLKMLTKEKALYTKLEICNILATGNALTIERMIPYVGKIGGNQYHNIAKKVSMKKSYPLPRDIIARTMAKMDSRYFESILENLHCKNDLVVAEIIDAVGWQVFYHQELAVEKYYQVIIDLLNKHRNNEFMLWKLIICLSSFNQAEDLLRHWNCNNLIIKQEIQRSIDLIVKRKNII